MFASFHHPRNLSQRMMRVIFSIYLVVTVVITSMQFLAEYMRTQNSILTELKQLEETIRGPISASLWQYDINQIDSLIAGLIKIPTIEGIDIIGINDESIISKRSSPTTSAPRSLFDIRSDLTWKLKDENVLLGSLILYSSSAVVLDRVLFCFSLVVVTAIIKLSILFWLFIWAFDRYLASPLRELISQVNEIQLNQNSNKRIRLSNAENNELNKLQEHMNDMLTAMEGSRERLLEDERGKRNWLETAVAKRTEELEILNKKLKELATKDSLTGALNRGSFFETAQNLLALSQRRESPASFVLMDLDHFKLINDTHGHFIGDKVLIDFTKKIQALLRKSDLIGRVGGEEFAIFLPDTGTDDAYNLAEKIRKSIGSSTLKIDGKEIIYTVSIGVESANPEDHSLTELFKRADLKLYGAKDKGRDRVE